jgi:hypothetical protein
VTIRKLDKLVRFSNVDKPGKISVQFLRVFDQPISGLVFKLFAKQDHFIQKKNVFMTLFMYTTGSEPFENWT